MDLLLPARFEDPETLYAYTRVLSEEVAAGERPPAVSITPSSRRVGAAKRDTTRPGFARAVEAAHEEGYPVLVRSSGGGAIAAHHGTFGFSIVRPAGDDSGDIQERYDEAYAAMDLPMRPESVGSLHRAGNQARVEGAVRAFAEEAKIRYDTMPAGPDERILRRGRKIQTGIQARSTSPNA